MTVVNFGGANLTGLLKLALCLAPLLFAVDLRLCRPTWGQSETKESLKKQMQELLPKLEEHLEAHPDSSEGHYCRGMSRYLSNDHAGAESDFARAESLGLKDKLFDFYSIRGLNFLLMKRYVEAEKQLNLALKMNPSDTLCLTNRACVYCETGRYREALVDAQRAISLAARGSTPHCVAGTCYLKCGQYKYALQYLDKAVQINFKNSEALYMRAVTCEKLGLKERAAKDFAAARALGYKPGESYNEEL